MACIQTGSMLGAVRLSEAEISHRTGPHLHSGLSTRHRIMASQTSLRYRFSAFCRQIIARSMYCMHKVPMSKLCSCNWPIAPKGMTRSYHIPYRGVVLEHGSCRCIVAVTCQGRSFASLIRNHWMHAAASGTSGTSAFSPSSPVYSRLRRFVSYATVLSQTRASYQPRSNRATVM